MVRSGRTQHAPEGGQLENSQQNHENGIVLFRLASTKRMRSGALMPRTFYTPTISCLIHYKQKTKYGWSLPKKGEARKNGYANYSVLSLRSTETSRPASHRFASATQRGQGKGCDKQMSAEILIYTSGGFGGWRFGIPPCRER
jgi:hypothetical protein